VTSIVLCLSVYGNNFVNKDSTVNTSNVGHKDDTDTPISYV